MDNFDDLIEFDAVLHKTELWDFELYETNDDFIIINENISTKLTFCEFYSRAPINMLNFTYDEYDCTYDI